MLAVYWHRAKKVEHTALPGNSGKRRTLKMPEATGLPDAPAKGGDGFREEGRAHPEFHFPRKSRSVRKPPAAPGGEQALCCVLAPNIPRHRLFILTEGPASGRRNSCIWHKISGPNAAFLAGVL